MIGATLLTVRGSAGGKPPADFPGKRMWRLCVLVLLLSGCSAALDNAPTARSYIASGYPSLMKVEKTPPPNIACFFEHPDYFAIMARQDFADDPVTIVNAGEESLGSIVHLADVQVRPTLIARNVDDITAGILNVSGMPFVKFLKYLKDRYDVHVIYEPENGTIVVQKEETRKIVLPPILESQQGVIGPSGDEDAVSVQAQPDYLGDFITKTADGLGVKIIAFSKTTGVIQYRGRPSAVQAFTEIVEREANERLKFVTLHIMILDVGVDNGFERDLRLQQLGSMGNIFGTFKFSLPAAGSLSGEGPPIYAPGAASPPTSLAEGMTVALMNPVEDKFSMLLGILEKWGTTEVVQAPAVMTANGVPVSFKVVEEGGYWQPGELVITEATSNAPRLIQEDKPEFVDEETGLKLLIRPKIIKDPTTKEDLVELDISLDISNVIGMIETTWQREASMDPVIIGKPVIARKALSSRAILHADEMLMLAQLDRKDNSGNTSGLPGTLGESGILRGMFSSRAIGRKESRLLIVINAVLPKIGVKKTASITEMPPQKTGQTSEPAGMPAETEEKTETAAAVEIAAETIGRRENQRVAEPAVASGNVSLSISEASPGKGFPADLSGKKSSDAFLKKPNEPPGPAAMARNVFPRTEDGLFEEMTTDKRPLPSRDKFYSVLAGPYESKSEAIAGALKIVGLRDDPGGYVKAEERNDGWFGVYFPVKTLEDADATVNRLEKMGIKAVAEEMAADKEGGG